jgi:GNAT superfamily N-acetyltransferase
MTSPTPATCTVDLLAHHPHLTPAVGQMRWYEWGHDPEPQDRSWWVTTTRTEAGVDELPVTYVAINQHGEAIGAVGLEQFDIEERRDRSPWFLGMIVRPDHRGAGVGRQLLTPPGRMGHPPRLHPVLGRHR